MSVRLTFFLEWFSFFAGLRFFCQPYLTDNDEILESIQQSVLTLKKLITEGHPIYGMCADIFLVRERER